MRVTTVPPNPEARARRVADWMLPILASPTLAGRSFPPEAQCVIFMDGEPKITLGGSWSISGGHLYLPQESNGHLTPLDRLGVMGAIAGATGANTDPRIMEALTTRLVTMIQDSTLAVYSSVVVSNIPPKRLAVNVTNCQVAAELNGRWVLPSGAPVEVDNSWITMDF